MRLPSWKAKWLARLDEGSFRHPATKEGLLWYLLTYLHEG
jgi:hypothetical protein